jgi:hypothetical protein
VSDTEDITQLVLRERQGRDRGWWDEMERCYWPDSRVTISWYDGDGPGFIAASKAMSGRGVASVHRMSPLVVRVRGDRGWAEAPALIEVRAAVDGVPADLISAARLNYRLERRDGRWGIAALTCVYERDTLTPTVPGAELTVPAAELAGFRPSYALLSWYLVRAGYQAGNGLLGDDEPAARDAFYTATWAWLNGQE